MYSCVAGGSPRYERSAVIWAMTLLRLAGRSPDELVVHAFEPSAPIMRALAEVNVEMVALPASTQRRSPLDKLGQLSSERLSDAEHVVLCDCDLAFAADISDWVGGNLVRAKVVDLPVPPLGVWRSVLKEAGFRGRLSKRVATHRHARTYANNFNGGLYILPRLAFEDLRVAWPRWCGWLLARPNLLGRWTIHADQIAFGLAIAELEIGTAPLPPELNFPTHLRGRGRRFGEPRVLHYHDRVAPDGALLPPLSGVARESVSRVNRVVATLDPG